jgi:hypothetical protein
LEASDKKHKQYSEFINAVDALPSQKVRSKAGVICAVEDAVSLLVGAITGKDESLGCAVAKSVLKGEKNLYTLAWKIFNRSIYEGVTPMDIADEYIEAPYDGAVVLQLEHLIS